jgi:hypothetical protein
MPKFGFYIQDLLPSAWTPGARVIGEDVGCELGLRRTAAGDSEVFVKVSVCVALRRTPVPRPADCGE